MIGGQFLGGILKQKPKLPAFVPTEAGTEAGEAIKANQANLGSATTLANTTNEANQAGLLKALRTAIPNYDEIMGQGGANVSSMLKGELPPDVEAAVNRSSAGRALAGGYGGAPASRSLAARDLGLTSYQITTQGLESAMRWLLTAKQTSVAPQMDVSSMFITPAQQYAASAANRAGEYESKLAQAQLNAKYDWRTILGESIQTFDQQATQAGFSLAGKAAGAMI